MGIRLTGLRTDEPRADSNDSAERLDSRAVRLTAP